ncbi:MAG TPA: nickel-responsive transcriptional regulator NikR [bacterium]|nr:nickel-responsive transcriptional regulator NikR [bacterium]
MPKKTKSSASVSRFGVSLEPELLDQLDLIVSEQNFANRSQAIRSMVRDNLVKQEWLSGKEVAGTITLVYDHHKPNLLSRLTEAQHRHHHLIISTQHIHLDHNNCMEIVVIRGKPSDAQGLLGAIKVIKGIKFSALSTATTADDIP